MHTKTFPESDQKHIKIAPKIIKNPLKIDPWRASGTPWRPYLSQGRFLDHFWLHFRPQKGPQNQPKIEQFLCLLLHDFLEPLFHALGINLAPKTTPKRDHKETQDQNTKIIYFAAIYYTCATLRGPENHHFWCFFGTLFKIPFRDLFFIDFEPFWGPFWDPLGTKKAP